MLAIIFMTTIPGGITYFIYMYRRRELNNIMKKGNSNYSGHINNAIDIFRIILALKKSRNLSKYEKQFLKTSLLLLSVTSITVILWLIAFVFFSDRILA